MKEIVWEVYGVEFKGYTDVDDDEKQRLVNWGFVEYPEGFFYQTREDQVLKGWTE